MPAGCLHSREAQASDPESSRTPWTLLQVSCTKSLEAQLGDLRSSQERKTEEIGSLRRAVTQLQAEQEATEKLKTVSAAQSEKLLAELARANLRYELEHQSLVGAGKTLKRVEDERNTLNATATGLKQELEGTLGKLTSKPIGAPCLLASDILLC